FSFSELGTLIAGLVPSGQDAPDAALTIPSERWDWRSDWNPALRPGGAPNSRLRLIEHIRTYYRADDLPGGLPLGQAARRGLPGETDRLALTDGLVTEVYAGRVDATIVTEGGYVHSEGDGDWWIPSGQLAYDHDPQADVATELGSARAAFFQPCRYRDA